MCQIYESCEEVIMWLGESSGSKPESWTVHTGHDRLRHFPKAGTFTSDPNISEDYNALAAFSLLHFSSGNRHVNEFPCFLQVGDDQWDVFDIFGTGFNEL